MTSTVSAQQITEKSANSVDIFSFRILFTVNFQRKGVRQIGSKELEILTKLQRSFEFRTEQFSLLKNINE